MNRYEHLPLTPFQGEIQRKIRGGRSEYKIPLGRIKNHYAKETEQKIAAIVSSHESIRNKYSGILRPSLIFELEINQGLDFKSIEKTLVSMGIHILSSAENKKGYWVVFSDEQELSKFKKKLSSYGSPDGPKYDFFNAFGELRDIPREEKIGESLKKQPLTNIPEFIDIELWRITDEQKNVSFINELKAAYPDQSEFRVTDQIITKSFVLLRVKLSKSVFDEIIELKEVARTDRPAISTFKPFNLKNVDLLELEKSSPDENATGILIIDSGIISNHPLLEKCIGDEENFQSGETASHDTVGHGTAVAGCAAYGDIEKCVVDKKFMPSNWIFSAKVMYAEKNSFNGEICAVYDPEKLVESQLKDAVEHFISHPEYHIRVVNISLGNTNEVWRKNYTRQLPLASIIDELAYIYPNIVFIVSTGNQHPSNIQENETIDAIKTNYPKYLLESPDYKIINPATSALAITVGSIAHSIGIEMQEGLFRGESIKTPIAEENQPSPFTRTGPGINGMIKPELVEYGGNLILYNNYGRISEDIGGKLLLLNNQTSSDLLHFDYGTSFATPKVAHIAGQIANKYPQRSANFIKNMLLCGATHPFIPTDSFYISKEGKALEDHLNVSGFGLPSFEKAVNSLDNRVVLFDEGKLHLNKIKVYSLQLPDVFFNEAGKKRIIINLSFTPETRSTRGDSYLGNRMEFHLYHTINPQELINKYGAVSSESEGQEILKDIEKFEIKLVPGANTRNAGCHQKAWKEFKREPKNRPATPVSLVLINYNKWMIDENLETEYCLSVVFEHEKEIDLYNQVRTMNQLRTRVR